MSWNFSAVGKPDKIIAALDEYGAKLTGQSSVEFIRVLPGFKTILEAIKLNDNAAKDSCTFIRFEASGHGCMQINAAGETVGVDYNDVQVKIEKTHIPIVQ